MAASLFNVRRSLSQSNTHLLRRIYSALDASIFDQCMRQTDLVSLHSFACLRSKHSSATFSSAPEHASPQPQQTAMVLDGRAVAAGWETELAKLVGQVKDLGGRPPGLGVILVGDRPDSHLYVARKQEACDRIGMHAVVRYLPTSVTQVGMRQAVRALCADPTVDGVLVQLPLPAHIDEEDVIEHFDPSKDVDGFHPLNVGRTLMRGRSARFVPCTALRCIELMRRSHIPIQGKSVAIVGDSNIVGMPLAMLFRDEGAATVTVIHRTSYSSLFSSGPAPTDKSKVAENPAQRAAAAACHTATPGPQSHRATQPYEVSYSSGLRDAYAQRNGSLPLAASSEEPPSHLTELAGITRTADILVVAVGYPQLIKGDWIKPGAVVLDVGINVVDWGGDAASSVPPSEAAAADEEEHIQFHVVGDVDYAEAAQVASAVTPVPGGVGPMTIAAVLHNTVHAAANRLGIRSAEK